jgi:hypothetical protein
MRNHHLSGAVGRISTGRLTCLLAAGLLLCTSPAVAVDELPDSGEEVLDSGDLPLPDNVRAGALLYKHPNYVFKPFVMPRIQGQAMDTAPLMGISSGNPPHAILDHGPEPVPCG